MSILLINAGSSSLKFSLLDDRDAVIAGGLADWAGHSTRYRFNDRPDETVAFRSPGPAVKRVIADLRKFRSPFEAPRAIGHRWVHGGDFRESTRITRSVRDRLAALAHLAPVHTPPSLEALDAALGELPDLPQVAIFDTTFHAALPPEAITYAVPEQWTREWGIRRFGFHGLSFAHSARRAAEMLGGQRDLRLVICHLGQGCSASAVRGEVCVETTMGFTPLEGLVMATRCGSIDPSILLHVQRTHHQSIDDVERALNRHSGLLGLSGVSGDIREVRSAARSGNERAALAIAIYVRRLKQNIGSLTAMLGGLDALVFTGGVGEHAPDVREGACTGLEYLGIELDRAVNASATPDSDVASPHSRVRVLVIEAREDLEMLREVRRVVP